MQCRALSDKNIVWFGKDGSGDNVYIRLSGQVGFYLPKDTVVFNYLFFAWNDISDWNSLTSWEGMTSRGTIEFEKDGESHTYYFVFNKNTRISGVLFSDAAMNQYCGDFSITSQTKLQNYKKDADAVCDSLVQRLSVIKGELWYQINYGLPLVDKISNKNIFDNVICDIILSHPGVANIIDYQSQKNKNEYLFTCQIQSIFGEIFTISNSYSI